MEPLSALSIATAVVQFLDFAGNIVTSTWEISKSSSGDSNRNSDLRGITQNLQELNGTLRQAVNDPNLVPFSSQDQEIADLCRKCNDVAEKLIGILDRVRSSSRDSTWPSFRAALRTMWNQDEVDNLQRTLDSYRQQISMLILVAMSSNYEQTSTTLAETKHLCHQVLLELDKSQEFQNDVLDAIKRSYMLDPNDRSRTTSDQLIHMQGVLRQDEATSINKRLIHSLSFREVKHRYEQIPLAYQETFEWIFKTPTEQVRWANFPEWIESNDPLYWITGKAGAGKSTLMKFIYDHQKTKSALEDWAKDDKLLKASFFFWNSDANIQMSLEGLVKTILAQVLEQMPELIPAVFPHRVEASIMFGHHIWNLEPWTWEELLRGFETMVKRATERAKLAVFIDGMDEFNGQPADLVEFINKMVSSDSNTSRIKVCAASRPWIAFEDAFRNKPHLQLEDLTSDDIKVYVTTRMHANPGYKVLQECDPDTSKQLIDNITAKASGVFLWVYLVTRSLLDGLTEGERLSDLQRRLDALPRDLESLFLKVIDTLPPEHFRRASQLFRIIQTSIGPLKLLPLSFADEEDPEFAMRAPYAPLTKSQIHFRCEFMRRRLTANCRGLLEAHYQKGPYELQQVYVTFLHRTVRDFLDQPEIVRRMQDAAGSAFNPNLRLCNAYIMKLKTMAPESMYLSVFWDAVTNATEYASRSDPQGLSWQPRLLNEIDSIASVVSTIPCSGHLSLTQLYGGRHNLAAHWIHTNERLKLVPRFARPFLAFAVKCQLVEYVRSALT
ncbi:hypothetical protein BU24DRAFT_317882, partial [Aaosphaeria arxii CBS 175.79]